MVERILTVFKATNNRRIKGLAFKESNKHFLTQKTIQKCRELDVTGLKSLLILEKVGLVNYELRLLPHMRINLFYKRFLETARRDAQLAENKFADDRE